MVAGMGADINMLGLNLGRPDRPLKVLCLGAHCDDIEIGCGGTILELSRSRGIDCTWVTFCSTPVRAQEAQSCAAAFLQDSDNRCVIVKDFRDGFLPYLGYEVKDQFEELKQRVDPDLIFTHYGMDKHQDHRLVSELTLNTFRNHFILEYEIPKYDGDLGSPNFFAPVSKENCQLKVNNLFKYYPTQRAKNWFTEDLFWSLLRLRGMEINSPSTYAESFYLHKGRFLFDCN